MVRSTKSCSKCDLTKVDLLQADLSKAILIESDLTASHLRFANLREAVLFTSSLFQADLAASDLSNADLRCANLGMANLIQANLDHALLRRASLNHAILQHSSLKGADLSNADLSKAVLRYSNLTGANLTGADLSGANLSGAVWTDGITTCQKGSIGRCVSQVPRPSSHGPLLFPSPSACRLPGAPPASALTLAAMYYVVFEGDNPLCVIETTETEAAVPEGLLRYEETYSYYVLSISTTDDVMDFEGPNTFTISTRPDGVDDFGNPLIAKDLRDEKGRVVTLRDNRLSTLVTAEAGCLPQTASLSALQQTKGVITDSSGNSIVTVNTEDVHVVNSNGGQGSALVMAASGSHRIGTIRPLTTTGCAMDVTGSLKSAPDVIVKPSDVSLPLGLFDFTVILSDYINRADVVIIPPTPFASNTTWYKVGSNGAVVKYPHFKVDELGNGILTLYDNDEFDTNPAQGVIRDPGGPGPGYGTSEGSEWDCGCFITTTVCRSRPPPFAGIAKVFREAVLLVAPALRSFLSWYGRTNEQMPAPNFVRLKASD